jgi:hypothetical protein
MKRIVIWLAVCSAVAAGSLLPAQAPGSASQQPPTLNQVVDRSFTGMERQFVSVAEEMPADKYSFAPTQGEFKGVRTFGQQVKHVAAVNYSLGGALLGEKPPVDTGDESGPDSLKTKDEIVKYLKDSFAYSHKAIATINEKTATEMVNSPFGSNKVSRIALGILYTGHGFDHYGQMVVYQRMNGIIPPPSRPQTQR